MCRFSAAASLSRSIRTTIEMSLDDGGRALFVARREQIHESAAENRQSKRAFSSSCP
jgi:hypothetical protein